MPTFSLVKKANLLASSASAFGVFKNCVPGLNERKKVCFLFKLQGIYYFLIAVVILKFSIAQVLHSLDG